MSLELTVAAMMVGPMTIPFHPKLVERIAQAFERWVLKESNNVALLGDDLVVERWTEQAADDVASIQWGDNYTDRLMFKQRLDAAIAAGRTTRERLKEGNR